MKKAYRIAPEIKEQILNRIKNEGVSVVQAAADHGVAEGTIYTWIAKKTDGQPTLAEVIKLKRENTQPLQLVGEITLKLSETQKRVVSRSPATQSSPGQRVGGVSRVAVLPTKETGQKLDIEMSD